MMSAIVSFEIHGIVSGNKDEVYVLPPNIKASAFQSGEIPAKTIH